MTILVYKDGRWLIDNEQPLEGVSLDNLAAFLSNPKDGDVVKYDEKSGMWIAGEAGGGSSGGGVLVVHDVNDTLDKTWKEIHDAFVSGGCVISLNDGNAVQNVTEVSYSSKGGSYNVRTYDYLYKATESTGYPQLNIT